MPKRFVGCSAIAAVAACGLAHGTFAQSSITLAQAEVSAKPEPSKAAPPEGIVPLIDYSGDLWSRPRLSGDWGGSRADLARNGLSFDFDWTQVGQGVVSGGRRIDWDYGGSFDFVANFDLQRMGVIPGAIVKLRTESRYGESVNDDASSILPVNSDGYMPLTHRPNEGVPITITELNYTQFLSKTFGLTIGKFQTLDGDPNEFAGGRGRSQFMNANFLFTGAGALIVPYSTLGGGIIWAPAEKIAVSSLMLNTTDSSTTTGFDHVENGWTWCNEADFQYKLGDLPGGQNACFSYAFAGDFSQLGGRLEITPGAGVSLPKEGESWYVAWSAWQYVYTPDTAPAKIDLTNGRPDLRGVGLFARAGFADPDTNPVKWTVSAGLGGRGLIPSRDNDNFGVGYVYTSLKNTERFIGLALEDSTQAIEAYYNFAITPAVGLTIDAQWTDGVRKSIGEATVLGMRLDVRF